MPKDVNETKPNYSEPLYVEKQLEQSTNEHSYLRKEKARDYNKKFFHGNKEMLCAISKTYQKKDRQHTKAYKRAYYLQNPEKFIEYRKTAVAKLRENSNYVQKRKEYDRTYYLQNQKKFLAYRKTYSATHRQK